MHELQSHEPVKWAESLLQRHCATVFKVFELEGSAKVHEAIIKKQPNGK
jgi:hypothetical protein